MDANTQQAAFDIAAITALIVERHQTRREENAAIRAGLLSVLVGAGIDRIEAHYDAYGDSGNIESVDLLRKVSHAPLVEGTEIAAEASSIALEADSDLYQPVQGPLAETDMTRLEDFLWTMVYCLHPGFENNEGGYGDIVWDLPRDTIAIEHSERFVDVNSYSYEDL